MERDTNLIVATVTIYWRYYAVLFVIGLAVFGLSVVFSKEGPKEWAYQARPDVNVWEIGGCRGDGRWPKEWPDIIVQGEPVRVVSPIYRTDTFTGKRTIMEKDSMPLSHIERYYTVVNTTDRVMAVKFKCDIENDHDGIREALNKWEYTLVFVKGHSAKRVRIWFTHHSIFQEVYRLSCRWDLAELKDSVMLL